MTEMNYKEAFEWVCEQIRTERKFAEEYIIEHGSDPRLRGMIFAYDSIKELCDNIMKYGVQGYKDICNKTIMRYSSHGTEDEE